MVQLHGTEGVLLTPETVAYPRTIEPIAPLSETQRAEAAAWVQDIIADQTRLAIIARQIADTVAQAAADGDFILARSEEDIIEKLQTGHAALIPARDQAGEETFRYYQGMTPLVTGEGFSDFPVVEGGTLISNKHARAIDGSELYRSSHVMQMANVLPFLPENALIILTSRALPSKRASWRAGYQQLRREYFPMLDALTCDSGCAPGQDDGRLAGVQHVIATDCGDCFACPVNQAFGGEADELSDSCGLYAVNIARAIEIERAMMERFGGSATRARSILVEGNES